MVSGRAHTCVSEGQFNCRVDDDDDVVNQVIVLALLWDSRWGEDVRCIYLLALVLRFVKKKKWLDLEAIQTSRKVLGLPVEMYTVFYSEYLSSGCFISLPCP